MKLLPLFPLHKMHRNVSDFIKMLFLVIGLGVALALAGYLVSLIP